MARTLADINREIAALQKEAEAVRPREIKDVIQKIREAISFYGLTPDDLFGGVRRGRKAGAPDAASAARPGKRGRGKPAARKTSSPPKYRDPATGKTWTGRGKRPGWFVQALGAGKQPEELAA